MSDKIKPGHLDRKAVLYVRQSSPYQVNHNLESQRLQYAMQEHLKALGWREIEVLDEDLGKSAAVAMNRSGFQKMVADVCLGKVGAVELEAQAARYEVGAKALVDRVRRRRQDPTGEVPGQLTFDLPSTS